MHLCSTADMLLCVQSGTRIAQPMVRCIGAPLCNVAHIEMSVMVQTSAGARILYGGYLVLRAVSGADGRHTIHLGRLGTWEHGMLNECRVHTNASRGLVWHLFDTWSVAFCTFARTSHANYVRPIADYVLVLPSE